MTRYYTLHPDNPQKRIISQAVEELNDGAIIAYPTDSAYALATHIDNRKGVELIRNIRGLKENHPMTLICSDIAQASEYALIDNFAFSYLKAITPGCYTFILPATKKVPKTVIGAKRKVVGIRIPAHPVAHALVEALGLPLLSSTLILPGEDLPLNDPQEIVHSPAKSVNLILDAGISPQVLSTVVELIGGEANIIREGAGPLEPFQS